MDIVWFDIGYLVSAALFIFGLKNLGHPRTAPKETNLGLLVCWLL